MSQKTTTQETPGLERREGAAQVFTASEGTGGAGLHRSDPVRLLIVASHVVQYSAPVFRKMAEDPRIDLAVCYCCMHGAERGFDPGFGQEISWDTPVLEGYAWRHVKNYSLRPGPSHFGGLFNPGLWNLICEGHYDAVLVSGYSFASAWIAIAAAKWSRTPLLFITDSHDLGSWSVQSSWKLRLKKSVVRRIFSLGEIVLALSSGGVQYLKSLGYPRDRLVLTPYVVDNSWWSERASNIDRGAKRADWRVPADAHVALFCAKLQPWKAPADLLEAFAQADVPNSFLVFAGDGPEKERLERRAAELAVQDRVRFLGFVNQSDLPATYRASDLLILPSRFEPFGLVVNEAMLCGLPVIVTDRVGARFDLIREGQTGIVYRAGDVNELAKHLRRILPDGEALARMGAAAKERMESWSPREYVDAMVRAVRLARSSARSSKC